MSKTNKGQSSFHILLEQEQESGLKSKALYSGSAVNQRREQSQSVLTKQSTGAVLQSGMHTCHYKNAEIQAAEFGCRTEFFPRLRFRLPWLFFLTHLNHKCVQMLVTSTLLLVLHSVKGFYPAPEQGGCCCSWLEQPGVLRCVGLQWHYHICCLPRAFPWYPLL